jgi:hypothetical protein
MFVFSSLMLIIFYTNTKTILFYYFLVDIGFVVYALSPRPTEHSGWFLGEAWGVRFEAVDLRTW